VPARLRFGRFELRPDERRLVADGKPVHLGPRAFNLLLSLVERRDRVVPKRELLEAVWPGTTVDEGNLTVQASALRKLLGADAIITIAGQGYQFALPVATVEDESAEGGETPAVAPTLAVLPFETPAGESRLRLLADALVEDAIALLARTPGLLVIAFDSSAQFGQSTAADAAGQLGVRYVAEGSLTGHEVVTVSLRLSDAATGFVLWSGRLQAPAAHVSELQMELAARLLAPLRPQHQVVGPPIVRRRPADVEAWGLYRNAVAALAQGGWGEAALAVALAMLQRAGEDDPGFAVARSHRALLQAVGVRLGRIAETPATVEDIAAAAARSAADDPGCAQVLAQSGSALAALGRWDDAAGLLEQALAIDPSNALAHVALGVRLCVQGQVQPGIERLRLAMRLSPRDRRLGFWSWVAGTVLLRDGQLEGALEEASTAARRDPQLFLARVLEAVVLQRLGREEEALVALQTALQLRPQLSLDEVARLHGPRASEALALLWERAAV
jgi:DNA-binding winged helix-turn-helix (wHTH) protein/Flp pilus assembly protein TadD